MYVSRIFNTLSVLVLATAGLGNAQDSSRSAIQTKLETEFPPTKATADKTDIVTAGAVLVLKKDNLQMVDASSSNPCQNTYKDGKISQSLVSRLTCAKKVPGIASSGPASRTFVAGEKLWATRIDVRDKEVVFELLTDPFGETRYKAMLAFPFGKGGLPSVDRVVGEVAEVFKVQPAESDKGQDAGGQQQPQQPQQPAPPPRRSAPVAAPPTQPEPIAPPPPPPADKPEPIAPPPPVTEDAPPKTIALGQTTDQVVAIYGKPERTAKIGEKEIYSYKDLKITFVKGKVTDVQ